MGCVGSSEVNNALEEVQQITSEYLGAFTVEYNKLYVIKAAGFHIQRLLDKQGLAAQEGAEDKLEAYEGDTPVKVVHEGVICRKDGSKWPEVYVVVRGTYVVDIYATKEDYEAEKKPLDVMNLSSRVVRRDPAKSALDKIADLAKKVNLPESDFPKPDPVPEFALELEETNKESIFFKGASADDHKEWCRVFEQCTYLCPRLNITDDEVHQAIFDIAVQRACWSTGFYFYWWGGGEDAIISSAITRRIVDRTLSELDKVLTQPWSIRSRLRAGFMAQADTIVSEAVKPAWTEMYGVSTNLKEPTEKRIDTNAGPVLEAFAKARADVEKKAEDAASGAMKEYGPNMDKVIKVALTPVSFGFKALIEDFDDVQSLFDAFKAHHEKDENNKKLAPRGEEAAAAEGEDKKDDTKADWGYLVKRNSWSSGVRKAAKKIQSAVDDFEPIKEIFAGVRIYNIIDQMCDAIERLQRNAMLTLEKAYYYEMAKDGAVAEDAWKAAMEDTKARLVEDARRGVLRTVAMTIFMFVRGTFDEKLVRPAEELVKPIADELPDDVKELIDPVAMLGDQMRDILRRGIKVVVQSAIPNTPEAIGF